MLQSEHLSREDLAHLLQGDAENAKTRRAGRHIQECPTCRAALDDMAAASELWSKAPRMLREQSFSSLSSGFNELDTVARPTKRGMQKVDEQLSDPNEVTWNYPIDSLLETPRHPEMVGRLGKYDIERVIGQGGMGIVFKAHDSELNRPLAIKVLAPHLANHGTARQRFAQEARAAAGVIHPNVIAVYGVSNEGKTPHFVMPYVSGSSLQTLIETNGPLDEIEIVRIGLQIASALAAAHSQGLVHRDVKPANILIEEGGRVLVTDFGLARAEDDASLTRTGWLTGTPNYMSPEQTRGERIDHRSDLFSLGSLLYFLATGRLPFRSESPLGVLNRIQSAQPTPVRHVNRRISQTLAEIIEVLLEKQPAKRFQNAAALYSLLEKHLAYLHQPDISKPPTVKQAPAKRNNWYVIAGSVLALVTTALFLIPMLASQFQQQDNSNAVSQGNGGKALNVTSNDASSLPGSITIGVLPDSGQQESEKIFQINVRQKPDDKSEYQQAFNRGFDLISDGEYDKAIQEFEFASKHPDLLGISTYNIGCALAQKGKTTEALDSLELAFGFGFDQRDQYADDSDLDSLQDKPRFKRLIESLRSREKARELVNAALAHNQRENFKLSERLCQAALEMSPGYSKAALMLGYAKHMQGKLGDAMQYHVRAANSPDYSAVGLYNIGCASVLQGNNQQAITVLQQAIRTGLGDSINRVRWREDSDLDALRDLPEFKQLEWQLESNWRRSEGSRFRSSDGDDEQSSSEFFAFPREIELPDDYDFDMTISGDWDANVRDDTIDLQLRREMPDAQWDWSFSTVLDTSDLEPVLQSGGQKFRWRRASGQFIFEGTYEDNHISGTYAFVPSEDFSQQLANAMEKPASRLPSLLMFKLFFEPRSAENMSETLAEMQSFGLRQSSVFRLLADNISAYEVERYADEGLDPQVYLELILSRVKPSLVRSYLDAELKPNDFKQLLVRRVPAKMIQQYRERGLDPLELTDMITSRISADSLVEYTKLGIELGEVTEFARNRVSPKLLAEYRKNNLDLSQHRRLITAHVHPRELKKYREANLDPELYQSFIARQVPPQLVEEYEQSGTDVFRYYDMVQLQVPPERVKEYESAGLSPSRYQYFIVSGADADDVKSYVISDMDVDQYKWPDQTGACRQSWFCNTNAKGWTRKIMPIVWRNSSASKKPCCQTKKEITILWPHTTLNPSCVPSTGKAATRLAVRTALISNGANRKLPVSISFQTLASTRDPVLAKKRSSIQHAQSTQKMVQVLMDLDGPADNNDA